MGTNENHERLSTPRGPSMDPPTRGKRFSAPLFLKSYLGPGGATRAFHMKGNNIWVIYLSLAYIYIYIYIYVHSHWALKTQA